MAKLTEESKARQSGQSVRHLWGTASKPVSPTSPAKAHYVFWMMSMLFSLMSILLGLPLISRKPQVAIICLELLKPANHFTNSTVFVKTRLRTRPAPTRSLVQIYPGCLTVCVIMNPLSFDQTIIARRTGLHRRQPARRRH